MLAVFTVTNLDDLPVAAANDAPGTLRQAIFDANDLVGADEIVFDSALTSGGAATITLYHGELEISESLTITGPGADLLTIDASGSDDTPEEVDGQGSRIFSITAHYFDDILISKLTLTGGDASGDGGAILTDQSYNTLLQDLVVTGNHASGIGGGIYGRGLEIEDCLITGNSATTGGGAGGYENTVRNTVISGNQAVTGGGFWSYGSSIYDSVISNNTATGRGGGIATFDDRTPFYWTTSSLIERTTISGNTAPEGGGVAVDAYFSGSTSIRESIITDNHATATDGGGVSATLNRGSLLIADSTVSGNTAVRHGGGVFATDEERGTITLRNNRIEMNEADENGGGAHVEGSDDTDVTVEDNTFAGNTAGEDGGGLWFSGDADSGVRDVLSNVATNNSSGGDGGGIWAEIGGFGSSETIGGAPKLISNQAGGSGGGLWLHTYSPVELQGAVITKNEAGGAGGGIYMPFSWAALNLVQTTISGNESQGDGGGLNIRIAELHIEDSTIDNNKALGVGASGGGIFGVADLTMRNSTVSGNSASHNGGGIQLYYYFNEAMKIAHSTITGNKADVDNSGAGKGGGIYVSEYSSALFELDHTIIAGNKRGASTSDDFFGPVELSYSLIGDETGADITDGGNNQIGTSGSPIDPLLGPLVNNGGPTRTHALLSVSPAIDAGNPSFAPPPSQDQRGTPWLREYNGTIDLGAFERQPNPLPGDYNFDGKVSAADYTVWRDTNGSTIDLRADGSGPTFGVPDNVVDDYDFDYWIANYGNTLEEEGSGAGAAVQEDKETRGQGQGEISDLGFMISDFGKDEFRMTNVELGRSGPRFTVGSTVSSETEPSDDELLLAWRSESAADGSPGDDDLEFFIVGDPTEESTDAESESLELAFAAFE